MVEVNRRTGIGAIIGGIFGGPTAAKEASGGLVALMESKIEAAEKQYVNAGMPSINKYPSPAEIAEKEESEVKYLRRRIKKLQRAIKGDFSKEDDDWDNDYSEPERYRNNRIEPDIDCLKSVSKTIKFLIMNKRYYLRDVENQKERAKRDLEHLVKKQIRSKLMGRLSDLFK